MWNFLKRHGKAIAAGICAVGTPIAYAVNPTAGLMVGTACAAFGLTAVPMYTFLKPAGDLAGQLMESAQRKAREDREAGK